MLVPRTIPICAAWTDDLMKKMVHAELQDYGDFGLANVRDKIFFQHFLLFSYLKNNFFLNYIFFLLLQVQEDEKGEDAHEDPVNPVNEVEEETTNVRTFYIYYFI